MKYFHKQTPKQTVAEEAVNAILHGLGALFSIVVLIIMIKHSDHTLKSVVSCTIFGITLISLYTFSTLYHSVWHVNSKRILRIMDHITIYLLIAGTYTPFLLLGLRGTWGWSLFFIIWALACLGVIFKLFFTGRFEKASLIIYVAMGWLVVVAAVPIFKAIPLGGLIWLFAGGVAYTFGIVFYANDHRYYFSHAMWHVFVMLGSSCHVIGILFYILQQYPH